VIDEELLNEAFASLAERIALPDGALERLRAASATQDDRSSRPRVSKTSNRRLALSAAALGLTLLALLGWWWWTRLGTPTTGQRAVSGSAPRLSSTAGGGGAAQAAAATTGAAAAGSLAPSPPAPPAAAQAVPQAGQTPLVVKTGNVQLGVRKGGFDRTMEGLTTLASSSGGFVSATQSSDIGGAPSGSVTLRVPASSFEAVLNQVRGFGKVGAVTTKGEDVTAQYVDLQARIDALSAARQRHLAILAKASAVGDILAVQQQIDSLQSQLEQLQGQQKVLDDQARYGTLTVSVDESGNATPAPPLSPSPWSRAWRHAAGGFLAGVRGLITVSGGLGFAVLLLAAVAGLAAVARRRLRRSIV